MSISRSVYPWNQILYYRLRLESPNLLIGDARQMAKSRLKQQGGKQITPLPFAFLRSKDLAGYLRQDVCRSGAKELPALAGRAPLFASPGAPPGCSLGSHISNPTLAHSSLFIAQRTQNRLPSVSLFYSSSPSPAGNKEPLKKRGSLFPAQMERFGNF